MSRNLHKKGWIRLHRSILDSDLHPLSENRPFTKFEAKLDMIMMANYDDRVIKGVLVERGQFSHSYRFLAKRYKWSLGKVQRFIDHLIGDEFLRRSDTQTGTGTDTLNDTLNDTPQNILSICKYERYQSGDLENDTPNDTLNDTLSDTQTGTKKKNNNKKRNNIPVLEISERKTKFTEKCKSLNILNDQQTDAFIDYWTETNSNGKKLNFEMRKTWNLEGRMRTWKRNDKDWNSQDKIKSSNKTLNLKDFKATNRGEYLVYCNNSKCRSYGDTLFAQNIFDVRGGHKACGSGYTNVKPKHQQANNNRSRDGSNSTIAELMDNISQTTNQKTNEKNKPKAKSQTQSKKRKEVYDFKSVLRSN